MLGAARGANAVEIRRGRSDVDLPLIMRVEGCRQKANEIDLALSDRA